MWAPLSQYTDSYHLPSAESLTEDEATAISHLFWYLPGLAWYWATVRGVIVTFKFSLATPLTLTEVVSSEALSSTLLSESANVNSTV